MPAIIDEVSDLVRKAKRTAVRLSAITKKSDIIEIRTTDDKLIEVLKNNEIIQISAADDKVIEMLKEKKR